MANAKEIIIKVLSKKIADDFVKKCHYSGKVCQASQLHFGAFLNDTLHGVMQFGPSLDKSKLIGLVKDTKWNEFIELNRMAFDDVLPRNSESRCISVAMRLIKKYAPHIKWIVSFADGSQCGDGTIYRASGFVLTKIGVNKTLIKMPGGEVIANISITNGVANKGNGAVAALSAKYGIKSSGGSTVKEWITKGGQFIKGFQLRYIYFLDKSKQKDLTVPIIPFSKIEEMGAGMYKGKAKSCASSVTITHGDSISELAV